MAVRPEVIDYIAQQLKTGIKKDAIKKVLVENGWREGDIDEALSFFEGEGEPSTKPQSAPIQQPKPIVEQETAPVAQTEPIVQQPKVEEQKPEPVVQVSTIDAELQKDAIQSESAQKISAMLDGADSVRVAEPLSQPVQPVQQQISQPIQPLQTFGGGDSEITKFIKAQRAEGISDKKIKKILKNEGGWNDGEIEKAMTLAVMPIVAKANVSETTSMGKLPSIGTLFRDTLSVFAGRIWALIGVAIIPAVVSVSFIFIFLFLGGSTFATALTSLSHGGFSDSATIVSLVTAVLAVAVLALVHLWGTTALYHVVIGAGEKIGIGEAYKRGWAHIGSYLWFSIVAMIVLMGAFLLFFIPGIIVAVWMSVALVVLIAENELGMRAIVKSREYVRGNWWGVFIRYIVLGLLLLVVYGAIGFAGSISTTLSVVMGFVSSAMSVLVGAFIATYSYILYLELRVARGSFIFAPSVGRKITYLLPTVIIIAGIAIGVALVGATFINKGINIILSPTSTTTEAVNNVDELNVPDFELNGELDGFEADIGIIDTPDDTVVCNQVVTRARNPETGSIVSFPTPCDVPSGWEQI